MAQWPYYSRVNHSRIPKSLDLKTPRPWLAHAAASNVDRYSPASDTRIRVLVQMTLPSDTPGGFSPSLPRRGQNRITSPPSGHLYSCWLTGLNLSFHLVVDACIYHTSPQHQASIHNKHTNICKWNPIVMSCSCSKTALQNKGVIWKSEYSIFSHACIRSCLANVGAETAPFKVRGIVGGAQILPTGVRDMERPGHS
ncbi:hypothetical protein K440DRAFT_394361 [Wilcoxina mikolae CBS 423.85]|nr:hypothetical protein K440DRAFT_394361 [Wilcoxina mikolae CBS 423.85]